MRTSALRAGVPFEHDISDAQQRAGESVGPLGLDVSHPDVLSGVPQPVMELLDGGGGEAGVLDLLASLHAKEERLRRFTRAVEQSPAMIVVTDVAGSIEYVNPKFCQVTGYAQEEVLGQKTSILKSGGMAAETYEEMWRTILTGGEWQGELQNRKKNGETFWVLSSISPIRDEAGEITHFMAIKEDITHRKQVEQELVNAREEAMNASRAKSDFLANMSHEIRTPLNAIIGMADVLWETSLSAEQREYVRVLRRGGSTLLNLINDVLDLSKVEAGHLSLEAVDFDLRGLLEKTCDVMSVSAHEKDVELVYHVKSEVPGYLIGDPTRLRQILMNLVGNAIKFTEHGGVVVEVGLDPAESADRADRRRLHFSVRDTGIGIAPEKLGTIFERFAQASADTTRHFGGTGLGLTISRRLVELMGGTIWVESEVGYGSTFHFTAEFGVPPESNRSETLGEPDLKGLRVLVVDDNSTNRFVLKEMLSTWGVRVNTASGGRLALLELRRAREQGDPYTMVLLDCRMPDMDGFQLAARIMEETGSPDTTVMMLTSDRMSGDMAKMQEMGITNYLVKPIKRADLLDGMAVALGAPIARRELQPEIAEARDLEDTRHLKILLVEDSEDSRLLVQTYLKRTPYALDFAENGQEAVEKFKGGKYDIVLMDTQMPVMDGSAATRTIRAWEAEKGLRRTPIVALTAHALREDAQRSLEDGCDVHLTKPVKKAKLLATIVEYTSTILAEEDAPLESEQADGRILVRVDAEIEDLIPHYLENRRKEVSLLREGLDRGDFQFLRSVGHTMKGTGGGYGFEVISEIGREIEKAGADEDAGAVGRCIDRLADYVKKVEVVIE